jgi:hypothetical protein
VRRAAALLAVLAVALGGCGLGAGRAPKHVDLVVSEDFGAHALVQTETPRRGGSDTVMRLLQRNARVSTRYGGGFVQSIDGRAGGRSDGRPVDWFFYVNGVEADRGSTSVKVHDGDHVWWDRHDWGAAMRVPAVVGSFPEPFVHGANGKKLPVRIECGDPRGADCNRVNDALIKLGLIPGRAQFGAVSGFETLRVLVGTWPQVRVDQGASAIAKGPRASGVYARVTDGGRTIEALDARGRVRERLGAGTGLVAATRLSDQQPVWVLTGTDAAGVRAATEAFGQGESTLSGKFALAISDGRGIPLPVRAP